MKRPVTRPSGGVFSVPSVYMWYCSDMESSKGSDEQPTEVLATRLGPETKEALRRKAKANHRSMAAEARVAVLNHVGGKS